VTSLLAPTIAFAALALGAASVRAQGCRGCAQGEDTVPRTHVLPGLGIHVGTPQKASFAAGVVLGEDWRQDGRDHSRNVALWVEPGISAGRASVAYIDHGYGSFGSGFGVGASVLRTWKDPWTVKPNLTYVGGDLILWPIVFIGPRVGVFKSVSSGAVNAWFVSFDFGFGL
jgi:hypothetical protein